MKPDPSLHRLQRVRHEIRQREVVAERVEAIGPNFIRIGFSGESLADFASASFDDHIKFIFADSRGESVRRDYTPRSFDRSSGRLTVEFALHGQGAASDWARQAKVGSSAVIAGPRGSTIIPTDFDWHLLVGDATALPAIHRRIEELPVQARAFVVIHVEHADDRRVLDSAAQLDVHWVHSSADLIAAVRQLQLPPGEGFAWAGGEAAAMAQLRNLLLQEKALPREYMRIAAYWKKGAADFHERLDG